MTPATLDLLPSQTVAAQPDLVSPKPAAAPATTSSEGWHAVLPPASWHVIRLAPSMPS
jgi:hypothetical protein